MALLAGLTLGGHPTVLPGFVRDVFVGDQDTRVVREAIERVHDVYYRDISEEELADAAVDGVVRSLKDRFSHYFDPEEYQRFQDASHNAYEGIGISVVVVKKGLRVVEVYDGSPAERAGIRRGDVIVAVDGKSIEGDAAETGSSRIKGPPGTKVTLTIQRPGQKRAVEVNRARVTVPVVASRMEEHDGTKYAYVKLEGFTSGAHGEVIGALKKLLREGAKGVVFDLRGNGGGLVSEAQLVAGAFLDKGDVVVSTKGRSVESKTLKNENDPVVPEDVPVVVLVDRNSASASEIVTGALQDHDRAEVVGQRTFGKGVFQSILELTNGGALDITAGQYFTPDGRNLGGRGVKTGTGIAPDVKAVDKPKTRVDEALDVALDQL
jgi:carboxyl-terminal processing protease